jgi:hypothetical protein
MGIDNEEVLVAATYAQFALPSVFELAGKASGLESGVSSCFAVRYHIYAA